MSDDYVTSGILQVAAGLSPDDRHQFLAEVEMWLTAVAADLDPPGARPQGQGRGPTGTTMEDSAIRTANLDLTVDPHDEVTQAWAKLYCLIADSYRIRREFDAIVEQLGDLD